MVGEKKDRKEFRLSTPKEKVAKCLGVGVPRPLVGEVNTIPAPPSWQLARLGADPSKSNVQSSRCVSPTICMVGSNSPSGNIAIKSDKAWLFRPLGAATEISNSVSCISHFVVRPVMTGLDNIYFKGSALVIIITGKASK